MLMSTEPVVQIPPQFLSGETRVSLIRGFGSGEFLTRFKKGVESMAEALGLKLAIADADGDMDFAAQLIRQAVENGDQSILLSHVNGKAVKEAVQEARSEGIYVVAFDSMLDIKGVPEVEQDDMLMAHLLAKKLVTDTDGETQIIYCNSQAYAPLIRRGRAWDNISWRFPKLDIIAQIGSDSSSTIEDTRNEVKAILADCGGEYSVVAMWDEYAIGALKAVMDLKCKKRVRIYSIDITNNDISRMTAPGSPWVATVATDARSLGRLTLRIAAQLMAGETVPMHHMVEPQVITREFLMENEVRDMEDLITTMPSLGEDTTAWSPWMKPLMARNGHQEPAAILTKEELLGRLQTAMAKLTRRNTDLQLAGEVARDAAAVDSSQKLFNKATQLILERFGVYSVAIFSVDHKAGTCELEAMAGTGAATIMTHSLTIPISEGSIVGHVAGTGEVYFTGDTLDDQHYMEHPALPEVRSELCIPMKPGGKTIGVLELMSTHPDAFDQGDALVFSALADNLAVAYDRLVLFEYDRTQLTRQLDTVVGHSPVMIFAIDRNGVTTLAHGKGLEKLGISPERVTGVPFDSLTVASDKVENDLKRALKGSTFSSTITYKGSVFEAIWSPIIEADGEPAGCTVVATDVTDRMLAQEALQASEERYHELFQNSAIGIFMSTIEGRVLTLNPAAALMLGYNSVEEGMNYITDLASQVYANDVDRGDMITLLKTDKRVTDHKLRFIRKDGTPIWVSLNARLKDDDQGRPRYVEGMIQDITDRINAQEKLAELNRELEFKVRQRTRDLERQTEELEVANERLTELDRLKSEFLSTVSHDLRTPLTSILGFSQLIQREFERHFSPLSKNDDALIRKRNQIDNNLTIIREEGERLTRLITDFLDLSKIESGKMVWKDQDVDMEAVVDGAINAVAGQIEQIPNVELIREVGKNLPVLHVDPDRLIQVLVNLLNNAAKFTKRGFIRIRAIPVDDHVEIMVQDTGPGIPEADQQHIFDKFYQVSRGDTLASTQVGTGMGLAICREIIEHYKGTISVESEPDHGARFTISLPVN